MSHYLRRVPHRCGRPQVRRKGITDTHVSRLLRDEAGVTTLEYVVAGVALALAALAASRVLAGILIPYLHRIYVVVTLPVL